MSTLLDHPEAQELLAQTNVEPQTLRGGVPRGDGGAETARGADGLRRGAADAGDVRGGGGVGARGAAGHRRGGGALADTAAGVDTLLRGAAESCRMMAF